MDEKIEEDRIRRKSYYKTIVLIILLLLILLLLIALFVPVKKVEKKEAEKFLIGEPLPKGPGIIGQTRYKIVSSRKTSSIGTVRAPTKGQFIILSFEVENLASNARVLDYSMFRLLDRAKNSFSINSDLTWSLYRLTNRSSPWDSRIPPKTPTIVQAVFLVAKGPVGFKLACRDFDWRSDDYIELEVQI